MTEYEFMLQDRISKIASVDSQLNLRQNAYVSFSGGKDSVVLSRLVDVALPNNKIPRVFANTGLEFSEIVKFVKELAKEDERFVVLSQKANIKETLETFGYPFKSKEHSMRVEQFNRGSNAYFLQKYTRKIPYGTSRAADKFLCPKKLLYQFDERGKFNYSAKCCDKLKKNLLHEWQKENKKRVAITGMRADEGGNRTRLRTLGCLTRNNTNFSPLAVVSGEWEDWFLDCQKLRLCKLYYPPFNFKRTGCVGCPFNKDIQKELDLLESFLPAEKKKAELVFGKVYDEYRRINYRLKNNKEVNNADF